jgi:thiamine transporter 2/3
MNSLNINWQKWGEVALVLISSIHAVALLVYAKTESIYVMFGVYCIYRSLFQVMITIAQFNIARSMPCESYGVVFGGNTLISLILQSILTLVVTDSKGPFAMEIRKQVSLRYFRAFKNKKST